MPEFSDPQKASQLKSSMKTTLSNYGFNNQEIAQVYDHRIVMLVNDAMKYRNLQKAKPNIAIFIFLLDLLYLSFLNIS